MAHSKGKPQKTRATTAEPGLGETLKALRHRNKWSLAQVSEQTGLAVSTLSRIENNQLSLTYEKLLQLSRGLGLDLSELLSGGPAADVRTGRRAYTPPGQGRAVETKPYLYRYLCTELTGKKMTPIVGVIRATSIEEVGGFLRHQGEEVVYVLDGTLEVHTEFYEPLRMTAGGCVYFDSSMGHAFVAIGGPVTILSVCTGAEEELLQAEEDRRRVALVETE